MPDEDKFPNIDDGGWEEELQKLEYNYIDYQEVEAMESHDSFKMMAEFADSIDNSILQKQLYFALNKRKPFREFKFVIDNSGKYRNQWFVFRDKRHFEWVEEQVNPSNKIED